MPSVIWSKFYWLRYTFAIDDFVLCTKLMHKQYCNEAYSSMNVSSMPVWGLKTKSIMLVQTHHTNSWNMNYFNIQPTTTTSTKHSGNPESIHILGYIKKALIHWGTVQQNGFNCLQYFGTKGPDKQQNNVMLMILNTDLLTKQHDLEWPMNSARYSRTGKFLFHGLETKSVLIAVIGM